MTAKKRASGSKEATGRKKEKEQVQDEPRGRSLDPPGPEPLVESDDSNGEGSVSFPVVGVGASAGGLEAFKAMVRALPFDTGTAIVLVPHLDPTHSSMMTEILERETKIPIHQVENEMPVKPNVIYVIPPGQDMAISKGVLQLSARTVTQGRHRPIDTFFRSLAVDQRRRAIGVILSGTATDGTLGLAAIKEEGGITFAQDSTAQQESMPQSAIAAGCVDFVLPPQAIAEEISRIAKHPFVAPDAALGKRMPEREPILNQVLQVIRNATGVDFSRYKYNTLYRRISRRVVLHKLDSMEQYLRVLLDNPSERDELYRDILINVTNFFRNPEAFDALKTKVFPQLVAERSRHEPIRIWVVGCSTGEEAYSLAIVYSEFAKSFGTHIPASIFATDINAAGIDRARTGIYAKGLAQEVSQERLREFFNELDGHYRISKSIRDMCVFARHNVLTDPPFSRIDLVCCRNFLIYLESDLQHRVLPFLHYALRDRGFLMLGSSETIGSFRNLFEVQDTKNKIYSKVPASEKVIDARAFKARRAEFRPTLHEGRLVEQPVVGHDHAREADRILLHRYSPPGVIVNAEFEITQFRGDTGNYLTPAPGKASWNLLKMLREGLLVSVRGALQKSKRDGAPVREEGLRVRTNGSHQDVNVEVIPMRINENVESYLVLFEDPHRRNAASAVSGSAEAPPQQELNEAERELNRVRQELYATREYLQSVVEQQDAANEELQSANEEIQSSNEELQSINEELETSKEEIQSSNEELATLNEELQQRNAELSQSNNDLLNLINSVHMPMVMIGNDFRIRKFSPAAEKLLNLIPTDIGRPFTDIKLNLSVTDLEQKIDEVVTAVRSFDEEVRDRNGRRYLLRIRPYKTLEKRIEGAVILLIDVDEPMARETQILFRTNEPIFIWSVQSGIYYWNKAAQETYGYTRDQAIGKMPEDLLQASPAVFMDDLRRNGRWSGEVVHVAKDGSRIVLESRIAYYQEPSGNGLVIEANRPVSDGRRLEFDATRSANPFRDPSRSQFLAMLAHELRNPLAPLRNAIQVLNHPGADEEMRGRALQMLDRQVRNMTRMVDDLLDVSRLAQGKIQLRKEDVDLGAVLRRAIEQMDHHFSSRAQEIKASIPKKPVNIQADPIRMEQVFGNLLNNASKFTADRGHISIVLEESGQNGNEVVVRVQDDGFGILPEQLPGIFDGFGSDTPSHPKDQHGGLGIGLSLVRDLVAQHGGTVEAFSAGQGQGSEFTVRLPKNGALRSAGARESEAMASEKQQNRKVLVVDDNADAADSLAILLRMAGYEVEIAYDGPESLSQAASFKPDVVLLDIGLPGMDGYEVAAELKKMPELQECVLVAVTGYAREDDRRRARDAGFHFHLTKPINHESLKALLATPPED